MDFRRTQPRSLAFRRSGGSGRCRRSGRSGLGGFFHGFGRSFSSFRGRLSGGFDSTGSGFRRSFNSAGSGFGSTGSGFGGLGGGVSSGFGHIVCSSGNFIGSGRNFLFHLGGFGLRARSKGEGQGGKDQVMGNFHGLAVVGIKSPPIMAGSNGKIAENRAYVKPVTDESKNRCEDPAHGAGRSAMSDMFRVVRSHPARTRGVPGRMGLRLRDLLPPDDPRFRWHKCLGEIPR